MILRLLSAASLLLAQTMTLHAQVIGDFEGSKAGDRKELISGIQFRWCPAGTFKMGIDTSGVEIKPPPGFEVVPQFKVDVELTPGYWLGETEVTQEQWQNVMKTTPWKGEVFVKEGKDYAASFISHDDATAFCELLTKQERDAGRLPAGWKYSLPTEAQWEYACRAGTTTKFSFGDDAARLGEYAWWGGIYGRGNADGAPYAHRVGLKLPNQWGLHDIHGNVSEWCRDGFDMTLPGGKNPLVPSSGEIRVIRGGSWTRAVGCGAADRSIYSQDNGLESIGFRLAAVAFDIFEVGETVIIIRNADLEGEGNVRDHVWPGLNLKIAAIDGSRLQATYHTLGWIDGEHVVHLEQGIPVLTEMITRSPRDVNLYYGRASVWKLKADYDKAIADYSEAIRLDSTGSDTYYSRGLCHQIKREYDKAIADFNESIRLDPKRSDFCNSLAWLYATCPDAQYRDGKKALELAAKACELTTWHDADFIDTLAAAAAEDGDWDNAVRHQQQFIEMSKDEKQLEGGQKRLELYKVKKPFREDP